MPLKINQHNQFTVLIAGDLGIDRCTSEHRRRNIITANRHEDILSLIETTQFELILVDLNINYPTVPEIVARIKAPLGANSKTPVIAVINSAENIEKARQHLPEFDDWLSKPVSEEQLRQIISLRQTKLLAQNYVCLMLDKTKNNQRLALTIFEKLFAELPLQLTGIKDALANKQYDNAKDIAHKMNGSASFCGLLDIQQSANALESCLFNNNHTAAIQHFDILQQCILNFTRHQEFILANLDDCQGHNNSRQ